MSSVQVIVLAAGEGTRMRSSVPKVLHRAAGRTLVGHVVAAVASMDPEEIVVVAPADDAPLRQALSAPGLGLADRDLTFAIQDPPRGTGDAVRVGLDAVSATTSTVVVVNGDSPGITAATLRRLVEEHGDAAATCTAVRLDDPTGYGRIVRDSTGDLLRIVEETDCSEEERGIDEVNIGLYAFALQPLRESLSRLSDDNAQGEYYLTDVFELLREPDRATSDGPDSDDAGRDRRVRVHLHDDTEELHGVNTRSQLARAEALLRRRACEELMEAGVTLRDPERTTVDVDVSVGADTVIYPDVTLEAGTEIGSGCTLYPGVRVTRSHLGNGVTVLDGSIVEDSTVEDDASIGPYGRLRPGSEIGRGAKVGNFVETKKTRLGAGSKANHLTYLGDAEIGENVNIGAGTITCNYDGENKHRTVIGDGAFIGSNASLVAPVRIGRGAYVGAGSTITEDVPDGSLGLGRGRQVIKEGWARGHGEREEDEIS